MACVGEQEHVIATIYWYTHYTSICTWTFSHTSIAQLTVPHLRRRTKKGTEIPDHISLWTYAAILWLFYYTYNTHYSYICDNITQLVADLREMIRTEVGRNWIICCCCFFFYAPAPYKQIFALPHAHSAQTPFSFEHGSFSLSFSLCISMRTMLSKDRSHYVIMICYKYHEMCEHRS